MSAEVEIESIKRVRYGLVVAIPAAFSQGYAEASKLCKSEITIASDYGTRLKSCLMRIETTIDKKKRDLQVATDKQREHERAKEE